MTFATHMKKFFIPTVTLDTQSNDLRDYIVGSTHFLWGVNFVYTFPPVIKLIGEQDGFDFTPFGDVDPLIEVWKKQTASWRTRRLYIPLSPVELVEFSSGDLRKFDVTTPLGSIASTDCLIVRLTSLSVEEPWHRLSLVSSA